LIRHKNTKKSGFWDLNLCTQVYYTKAKQRQNKQKHIRILAYDNNFYELRIYFYKYFELLLITPFLERVCMCSLLVLWIIVSFSLLTSFFLLDFSCLLDIKRVNKLPSLASPKLILCASEFVSGSKVLSVVLVSSSPKTCLKFYHSSNMQHMCF